MIATIKDLNDFKLEINLKILKLKSSELARNWIISNYKTTTMESVSNFIIKDDEILIKVMNGLYVILPLMTEEEYVKQFKAWQSHSSHPPLGMSGFPAPIL